jgi:hypothetical protein
MGNFLSTKWGSFVKQFLAVMLMFTMTTEGGIANLGWVALLEASLLSMLPVVLKLTQNEGGFFNTWYGGLIKSLIVIVIAYFLQVGNIFHVNWSDFVNAVWTAFVPVIINILNPGDHRYGFGREVKEK